MSKRIVPPPADDLYEIRLIVGPCDKRDAEEVLNEIASLVHGRFDGLGAIPAMVAVSSEQDWRNP